LDRLCCFEKFSYELSSIAEVLGVPCEETRINAGTSQLEYREKYDVEAKEIVAKIYWQDVTALGYRF